MASMHTVTSLCTEIHEASPLAEVWSLRRMGTTVAQDFPTTWLVQKCPCSLNRWLSQVFSVIISTVLPHVAWRYKRNTQFNDQTNGRAERHPEFQPVSSLFDGRVWERRCTSKYTKQTFFSTQLE